MRSIIADVIEAEGGYVDNPEDRGGPTKFGITQASLSSYRGFTATVDDVKGLSRDEAEKIYELCYWNTMRLNRVRSRKVALVLFHFGVNFGPKTAIRLLQETLNVAVDGVLGNETDAAISRTSERGLCLSLTHRAVLKYSSIVEKYPSQRFFLGGWINRAFALLQKTVGV